MMRKVIALFDEYQSKENAKHVIRTMKENARQGFWNGATAPLGYKLVEAERRGTKVKKKLDIRQKFLGGTVDAIETELRVLEAEAELRTKTIAPRLALAQKELQRIQGRVDVGQATRVELSEATLRLLQLQTDRTKADLDLLLVQRQIQQHKSGR
jgi:hypothetical protein